MGRQNHVFLNLARGLASLAVVGSHLRNFLFVDFGSVTHANLFWKLLYFLTGLGHQAVMIFFVMSGFLIGTNVYKAISKDRWSWSDYIIKRLSRLWVVLIPALILTSAWDFIGIHVYHGSLYAGTLDGVYNNTSKINGFESVSSITTFLGNVLFLQRILVPTFGTNGPLWSLANEFWYYVIFPLAVFGISRHASASWRIVSAGLAVGLCVALPWEIVLYGLVWLFGFCVVLLKAHVQLQLKPTIVRAMAGCFFVLFIAVSAAPKFLKSGAGTLDFACGASFALLLYFLTKLHVESKILTRTSRFLSDISYTLYLTHFPFMALLSCAVFDSNRMQPSGGALAIYVGLLFATIGYAFCVYLLFERNTRKWQAAFSSRFDIGGDLIGM